ncbi:MAG: NTP transferase domain-containing protein [Muribaculaceae bacterium]|nr:NTP transferase domain-containing protein [Muribaculaceae bacterium]
MKAMILAAGLGTRLRPLTDKIPKALVEVDGVPMLELVIETLKRQGFTSIVVNVHHFGQQIIEFLRAQDFGIDIFVSDESDTLLDTGGGIVKAAPLLFNKDKEPVLVHNVDILSTANLYDLMQESASRLLVSDRESGRKLIFDEGMELRGWHNLSADCYKPEHIEVQPDWRELAFSGIYTITQAAVEEMKRLLGEGKYSIMDYFLHPERHEILKGVEQNGLKILDIGKPTTLSQASIFREMVGR